MGFLAFSGEEYEVARAVTKDGSTFLKKYSEYSNVYSNAGKEFESMRLEKDESTRMCTNCKASVRSPRH